jgi:hypothetical protein
MRIRTLKKEESILILEENTYSVRIILRYCAGWGSNKVWYIIPNEVDDTTRKISRRFVKLRTYHNHICSH